MKKGLFAGLLTIDLQFFAPQYPRENSKLKAKKFDIHIGGPATNAAITYAHLRGEADLVTAIGDHVFTEFIHKSLSEWKVNGHDLTPDSPELPTFASVLSNTITGDRTIFSYHPAQISQDQHSIFPLDEHTGVVLIDGFHASQALSLARQACEKNIPVVFDGGSWKSQIPDLIEWVDIAICSANFHPPGTSSHQQVFEYLKTRKVNKAVITRGDLPMLVMDQAEFYELPVPAVSVRDTLAAGDIFHGAFCYFLGQDQSFEKALMLAADIAAKSCIYQGPHAWMKEI